MSENRSVSPPCGSAIARHYRDRFRSCRRAWRTPPRSATCAMWRCRMPPTTASSCTSCARFGATAPSKRCTAAWSQPGSRSLPIPMRTPDTGAPGTRSCTLDSKIRVIGRWLRQHGASRTNPATVAVGFSTDEVHRANRKRAQPWETPDYPLLELGLSRSHCEALVARAGLPVPSRSACYFCPFHRPGTWARMRRDELDLFDRAVALEPLLDDRRARLRCLASGHPAVVYVIDDYDDPGDDTLVLAAETGHYRPSNPGRHLCDAADIGGTAISQRPFGILFLGLGVAVLHEIEPHAGPPTIRWLSPTGGPLRQWHRMATSLYLGRESSGRARLARRLAADPRFVVEDLEPCYRRLMAAELAAKVESAHRELVDCRACPRDCGVNRMQDELGTCNTGRHAVVASAFHHFGEEDCLRGWSGSGTIFFALCNLRCVFCQNWDISQQRDGREMTATDIAAVMLRLQYESCHNVNFVTPEHVVPQVVEATAYAIPRGL